MTISLILDATQCPPLADFRIADPHKSTLTLDTVLDTLRQHDNGRSLVDYVTGHNKLVGIVFLEEGMQCCYVPPWKAFDDIDEGFGDQVPKLTGGIVVVNFEDPLRFRNKDGMQELPLFVSFAHELGHAKQYLEQPEQFIDRYQTQLRAIEDKVPRGSKNRFNRDHEIGWSELAKIEMENDNVVRHEAPICVEHRLVHRYNYEGKESKLGL